jgi:hypothetical protein
MKPIFRWHFIAILIDKFGFDRAEVWEPPSVGEILLNKKREEVVELNPVEQCTLFAQRSAEIHYAWAHCLLKISTEKTALIACTLLEFQFFDPDDEQQTIREKILKGGIPEWNALTTNVHLLENEDSIDEMDQGNLTGKQYFTQNVGESESSERSPDDSRL